MEALKSQNTRIGSLTEADLVEMEIEDDVAEALEAMSLNMAEEIAELEHIIAVAKQAEFQHPDVKVERLVDTIDEILSEDRNQKIIIFTEFVATQKYLQQILENRGFTVSVLNGSMSIDERNEALQEFKTKTSIFISTDAGGEGLNLQFSNIIINYDLPWNPMKIEQRCGRADRIGQQRDVHIYNFIVGDTVENRVREVLEKKLSVIFKELGVDKYSDVLDSEVADLDFTEAYMNSIGRPSSVERNMHPIESEVKQQVANAQKYKNIIHEEKDLTKLVGTESSFDVDAALRQMLTYYESWKGRDIQLLTASALTMRKSSSTCVLKLCRTRPRSSCLLASRTFRMRLVTLCCGNYPSLKKKVESALFRFSSMKTSCSVRWPESVSWMFSLMAPAICLWALHRILQKQNISNSKS